MFGCKLCLKQKDDVYKSASDRNLCKECYKDIAKYRRLKLRTKLEPHDTAFVNRVDAMYTAAREHGNTFKMRKTHTVCKTCGCELVETTRRTCDTCYRREAAYYALHRYDPYSTRLHEYDAYYSSQVALGHKVPKLYHSRHEGKR